ncbi:kelch repeat and BTB domain-containing protein 12-like [Gigantopelta aegis]|uniref:kelch repeat and BTB domain-containing protein 12-like n=1 Tax=Gigantopelta aegis TaxID=1735272 RepID=UPI001B88B846|nr:kelch repeat and BTB domain-containing protein 12-like [Gigantopelta aegis]
MMENAQAQLLANIHEEIAKGAFTDIQIICKDGTTTGSRIVLAAMSSYFRAMFCSDMAESQTGVLNLPTVSLSVLQAIVKMCLCGLNLVSENNCVEVLDAAEMMQLEHIKAICDIFLKESLTLTAENCLNWWRLSKLYNFHDVSNRSFSCLADEFDDFVETENVVQLSKEELLEIISKEEMECTEDIILKGAMKWIEYNNPDQDDVKLIFENVHLEIVDSQFLIDEVLFSDIVCKTKSVQEMIEKELHSHRQVTASSRVNLKIPDVFVLQHNQTSLLSCFTSDNKWEDVPPAPVDPGSLYSAAVLNDKIYITGGYNKKKCTLIYNTARKVWIVGPDLTHEHYCHCMATANYKMYSIGGYYSNTIEELSESETHWQVVGDLRSSRYYAFPVTVGENILVMGGNTNSAGSNVIQCFNTTTHSVSQLNTKLPCRSELLRGSVHLPDVYLLDYDGHVMHLQVTNTDGEIKIQVKSTKQWKSFGCDIGVAHRCGSLLCFTEEGIGEFNLAEGKEEQSTFPKSPRSGDVYNVCSVSCGKTSR